MSTFLIRQVALEAAASHAAKREPEHFLVPTHYRAATEDAFNAQAGARGVSTRCERKVRAEV